MKLLGTDVSRVQVSAKQEYSQEQAKRSSIVSQTSSFPRETMSPDLNSDDRFRRCVPNVKARCCEDVIAR